MHTGRHFTLAEVLLWTRRELLIFLVFASTPMAFVHLGVDFPPMPWPPLAVLGTAVAFALSFKNNAAYGRLWEARQIWGGIVNDSRAFAVLARDFVTGSSDGTLERMVLRHVAWLTALRFQLREPRAWESQGRPANREYQRRWFSVPEREGDLAAELRLVLSAEEATDVLARKNRAAAVLALQSAELSRLCAAGRLSEYRQVELARLVTSLYEQQGKCERIKNFPYPRQYATMNLAFVWIFIAVLPYGIVGEVKKYGEVWTWLTVPLSVLVAWVFHTLEKIGNVSENPFEGGANDIPITAMSRTIEIELRELAGQEHVPAPIAPVHQILL